MKNERENIMKILKKNMLDSMGCVAIKKLYNVNSKVAVTNFVKVYKLKQNVGRG